MNICEGGYGSTPSHEEIVINGKSCPLCEALKDLADQEKEAEKVGKEYSYEVDKYQKEIERLTEENEQLRRGIDPAIEQKSW